MLSLNDLTAAFEDLAADWNQTKAAYVLDPKYVEIVEGNIAAWVKQLAAKPIWDTALLTAWNNILTTTKRTITEALSKGREAGLERRRTTILVAAGLGLLALVFFTRRKKHWLDTAQG